MISSCWFSGQEASTSTTVYHSIHIVIGSTHSNNMFSLPVCQECTLCLTDVKFFSYCSSWVKLCLYYFSEKIYNVINNNSLCSLTIIWREIRCVFEPYIEQNPNFWFIKQTARLSAFGFQWILNDCILWKKHSLHCFDLKQWNYCFMQVKWYMYALPIVIHCCIYNAAFMSYQNWKIFRHWIT